MAFLCYLLQFFPINVWLCGYYWSDLNIKRAVSNGLKAPAVEHDWFILVKGELSVFTTILNNSSSQRDVSSQTGVFLKLSLQNHTIPVQSHESLLLFSWWALCTHRPWEIVGAHENGRRVWDVSRSCTRNTTTEMEPCTFPRLPSTGKATHSCAFPYRQTGAATWHIHTDTSWLRSIFSLLPISLSTPVRPLLLHIPIETSSFLFCIFFRCVLTFLPFVAMVSPAVSLLGSVNVFFLNPALYSHLSVMSAPSLCTSS